MSGRVYTRRLAGPVSSAVNGGVMVLEVPEAHVYVVRFITVVNLSMTDPGTIRLAIGPSHLPAYRVMCITVPPVLSTEVECRLPLVAGEQLWRSQTLAETMGLTVSGYDFLE